MGFNRWVAEATTPFTYICSDDTALPKRFWDFDAAVENGKGKIEAVKAAFVASEFAQLADITAEDLADLEDLDTLRLYTATITRNAHHRKYRDTGDEEYLKGLEAESVIRWVLHHLTPAQRATVAGRLEEPLNGVPKRRNTYDVCAWILSQTCKGANGWAEFKAGADGYIKSECLALIPEDWVIEVGMFVYRLPQIRQSEKKA